MVLKLCTFTNLFTNLFIIYYFVYIQNYSCINRDEINVILSYLKTLLLTRMSVMHEARVGTLTARGSTIYRMQGFNKRHQTHYYMDAL